MNSVISVGCVMMVVVKQSSSHKMWTEITRRKYEREGQRYASDLTDAEWALIEPNMPAVNPGAFDHLGNGDAGLFVEGDIGDAAGLGGIEIGAAGIAAIAAVCLGAR